MMVKRNAPFSRAEKPREDSPLDRDKGPAGGPPRRGRAFIPWVITALLALAVVMLVSALNGRRQEQKRLRAQLEDQAEVIAALHERQKEEADTEKSVPVVSSQTIKSGLESLQELVTQEYIYTNADKRTQDAKWLFGKWGPGSKSTLVITYDGSIKAGIDMREIKVEVNEETRVIIVTLPESAITDNSIPQESIVVVEAKDGLFNEITLDDYNAFISEQKLLMEEKAIARGLLKKADEAARRTVQEFLSLMPEIGGTDGYRLVVQ